jgi:hypothetical protein
MDTLGQLLQATGMLGVLLAVLLGFVGLLIIPWWAIVDCVTSKRSDGFKAVVTILLILTWGLGSLIYGLALARSKALRVLTITVLAGVFLLIAISGTAIVFGARRSIVVMEEERQEQVAEIAASFRPETIDPEAVGSFHAVLHTPGVYGPQAASVASFTLAGQDRATARDTDKDVRHIAFDTVNERYFALTGHDFGTITPSSGRFTKIEVDPSLDDFSWPKGIAIDAERGRVVIMTSHVYTRFFTYDTQTSDWQQLPAELRDVPLVALAYAREDDALYALEVPARALALETIHRFNAQGAAVGTIALWPPIPTSEHADERYQLVSTGGWLLLLAPPYDAGGQAAVSSIGLVDGMRIFAIDPETGRVMVAP